MSPMAIPKPFINLIFSLIRKADKITTIIGVVVTNTELLMGVERSNPLKNASILIDIPNKAQIKSRPQSFLSIFSLGPRKEIPQKSAVAPKTRIIINPKGFTYIGITPLAMVWFNP